MNEVVVYSKPGCCLCEKVKKQLRRLQASYRFAWREVNIMEDPALAAEFAETIPVVLINGKKVFEYTLNEAEFVKQFLKQWQVGSTGSE
jgi:glutaredoxin